MSIKISCLDIPPPIQILSLIHILKEQVVDFAPQPVITKDNVTMQIDTVVYYQITDPVSYTHLCVAFSFPNTS